MLTMHQTPNPLPSLLLRLGTLSIDAPSKRQREGHHGLSNDSAATLALIAVSRLVRARDESILQQAAASPVGLSLLGALRAAVLRLASTANASLNEQSISTLFNLSGSTVASKRLYDGGLSLPQKLPHASAKALVNAMLEALNTA